MALKINISPTLLMKLNIISSEYDIEIRGYLIGEIKNNEIYVKDILFSDQDITKVSVVVNPIDQLNLRKKYGVEKVKQIIGQWHSHHKMGCFWSGTDEQNMTNVMKYRDVYIFIVSSNGKHLIRVSQSKPFRYDFNDCVLLIKSLSIDLMIIKINNIIKQNEEKKYNFDNTEVNEE